VRVADAGIVKSLQQVSPCIHLCHSFLPSNYILTHYRENIVADGVVDRVFSRRNCLVYSALVYPFMWAWGYGFFADKVFGYELPCCGYIGVMGYSPPLYSSSLSVCTSNQSSIHSSSTCPILVCSRARARASVSSVPSIIYASSCLLPRCEILRFYSQLGRVDIVPDVHNPLPGTPVQTTQHP
jgi:hypothetical protein